MLKIMLKYVKVCEHMTIWSNAKFIQIPNGMYQIKIDEKKMT